MAGVHEYTEMIPDGGWGNGIIFPNRVEQQGWYRADSIDGTYYESRDKYLTKVIPVFDPVNNVIHSKQIGDPERKTFTPFVENYTIENQVVPTGNPYWFPSLDRLPARLYPKGFPIKVSNLYYDPGSIRRRYPNDHSTKMDILYKQTYVLKPFQPKNFPKNIKEWRKMTWANGNKRNIVFEGNKAQPWDPNGKRDGHLSTYPMENEVGDYRKVYAKYFLKINRIKHTGIIDRRSRLFTLDQTPPRIEPTVTSTYHKRKFVDHEYGDILINDHLITLHYNIVTYKKKLPKDLSMIEFVKQFNRERKGFFSEIKIPANFLMLGGIEFARSPIVKREGKLPLNEDLYRFGYDPGDLGSVEGEYNREIRTMTDNMRSKDLDYTDRLLTQLKGKAIPTPESKKGMGLYTEIASGWAYPTEYAKQFILRPGSHVRFDLPLMWLTVEWLGAMALEGEKFIDVVGYTTDQVYGIAKLEYDKTFEKIARGRPHVLGRTGTYTYMEPVGINHYTAWADLGKRQVEGANIFTETDRYGINHTNVNPNSRSKGEQYNTNPLFIDYAAHDTITVHHVYTDFPKLYMGSLDVANFNLFRVYGNNNRVHITIHGDKELDIIYAAESNTLGNWFNHLALCAVEGINNIITIEFKGTITFKGDVLDPSLFYGLVSTTNKNTLILKFPNGKGIYDTFKFTGKHSDKKHTFYPFVKDLHQGWNKRTLLQSW